MLGLDVAEDKEFKRIVGVGLKKIYPCHIHLELEVTILGKIASLTISQSLKSFWFKL